MKQTALFSLILFLFSIVYTSCQEDIYADWGLKNEQWYQKHKNDSGFVQTSSGLCYKAIFQGNQGKPTKNSYVFATYTGSLIDGSVFDSGTDASLGKVSGLVSGFQEGIYFVELRNDKSNYIRRITITK